MVHDIVLYTLCVVLLGLVHQRCSNGACSLHGTGSTATIDKSCISGPRSNVCNQDWSKNQYFLSGKLEALDSAGEWFVEERRTGTGQQGNRLHFYPPAAKTREEVGPGQAGGCQPPSQLLEVKARDFVFQQQPPSHSIIQFGDSDSEASSDQGSNTTSLSLSLSGLTLRGATLDLSCCHGCTLSDLALEYPTFNREVLEMNAPQTNCTPAGTAYGWRVDIIGHARKNMYVNISHAWL